MTSLIDSSTALMWLRTPTRPIVPSTAVRPSSRGTPAATSEPKAINRITSVTGSEVTNAVLKSLLIASFTWLSELAWPNSPTVNCGWAACVAAIAASVSLARFLAVLWLPAILKRVRAEWPSGRDLRPVGRRVRALDRVHVRQLGQAELGVADRSAEREAVRVLRGTLHQHHLVGALRKGGVHRARRPARLADPGMGVVERLRPDAASDHERDDHERKPPPDRRLAMLGAPAAHSRGDIEALPARRCRLRSRLSLRGC